MMNLSISLDHRIVDGYEGAQFLQHVIELLRGPDADVHGDGVADDARRLRGRGRAARPTRRARSCGLLPGRSADERAVAEPRARADALARRASCAAHLPRHAARSACMDERLLALQRQGRIGFYGEARGQEAAVIGAAAALGPRRLDRAGAARGGRGASTAGCRCARYVAQIFGNANDVVQGAAAAVSPGDARGALRDDVVVHRDAAAARGRHGVGGQASRATTWSCSAASATAPPARRTSTSRPTSPASIKVPVVFFCQNNQWAISTPGRRADGVADVRGQGAGLRLARRARRRQRRARRLRGVRDAVERARARRRADAGRGAHLPRVGALVVGRSVALPRRARDRGVDARAIRSRASARWLIGAGPPRRAPATSACAPRSTPRCATPWPREEHVGPPPLRVARRGRVRRGAARTSQEQLAEIDAAAAPEARRRPPVDAAAGRQTLSYRRRRRIRCGRRRWRSAPAWRCWRGRPGRPGACRSRSCTPGCRRRRCAQLERDAAGERVVCALGGRRAGVAT